MDKYTIIYHMMPDNEDIVVTIHAKDEEDAIAFAKNYRKDSFSIRKEVK